MSIDYTITCSDPLSLWEAIKESQVFEKTLPPWLRVSDTKRIQINLIKSADSYLQIQSEQQCESVQIYEQLCHLHPESQPLRQLGLDSRYNKSEVTEESQFQVDPNGNKPQIQQPDQNFNKQLHDHQKQTQTQSQTDLQLQQVYRFPEKLRLRLVCISDTHSRHRKMCLDAVPRGDILLHTGDFSDTGSWPQIQDFLQWMSDEFKTRLKFRHIFLIAGNHDTSLDSEYYQKPSTRNRFQRHNGDQSVTNSQKIREFLLGTQQPQPSNQSLSDSTVCQSQCYLQYGVKYLEDQSITLPDIQSIKQSYSQFDPDSESQNGYSQSQGLKIYGSPWQPEFCDWAFNAQRGEELKAIWEKIPDSTDILLTHGPPLGRGDKVKPMLGNSNSFSHRVGCCDLLRRVQQGENIKSGCRPVIMQFGHIHEDYGSSWDGHTLYVNASTCNQFMKPENPPIVIDIVDAEGMWVVGE